MTNAELVLLNLIAEQPRHGYDIEQAIEERGMREWTEIGFSSIYYMLRKLRREKLIEGKLEETSSGPARKVRGGPARSAGRGAVGAAI
jgi:DNA-binding PadR family transcriptional regulator